MGLFGSLLARVTGQTSSLSVPVPNPASPTPLVKKLPSPADYAKHNHGGWVVVSSSNVLAIRWDAGAPVMGLALGKAPPVKAPDGTLTQQVPVAFRDEGPKVTDDTRGTLGVKFKNGSVYEYYGVPKRVHDQFYMSASKGKFVWRQLRGAYSYRRIK